jgi:hypothetical protein
MMKRALALLTLVPFLAACASATTIRSVPSGAKVYLNGEYVGETPLVHEDMEIAGSSKKVKLTHEGYHDQVGTIRKEELKVLPLIIGLCVIVPLLWVTGYPDEYSFTLEKD